MSGGGGGAVGKVVDLGKKSYLPQYYGGTRFIVGMEKSRREGANSPMELIKGGATGVGDDLGLLPPEAPAPEAAPTMEDIAAKEPDKERRRRQRMAALMAQGRSGTILTGPGGLTPNNSVGGGGKQMVGA